MPSAEINIPPHQHTADTTPALRGPARSSQPHQIAADEPSNTKNKVYIQPRVDIFQLQVELKISAKNPTSGPHLTALVMPSAFESGNQKT